MYTGREEDEQTLRGEGSFVQGATGAGSPAAMAAKAAAQRAFKVIDWEQIGKIVRSDGGKRELAALKRQYDDISNTIDAKLNQVRRGATALPVLGGLGRGRLKSTPVFPARRRGLSGWLGTSVRS